MPGALYANLLTNDTDRSSLGDGSSQASRSRIEVGSSVSNKLNAAHEVDADMSIIEQTVKQGSQPEFLQVIQRGCSSQLKDACKLSFDKHASFAPFFVKHAIGVCRPRLGRAALGEHVLSVAPVTLDDLSELELCHPWRA